MQTLTYKYKVYNQNRNHRKRLEEWFRTAAWIYNHAIALHKRYYRVFHKTLSLYRLQSHMLKLRKNGYAAWKSVGSQCVQQICERIKGGFDLFFRKEAKRPPTFKNWRKYRSVTFKQAGYTLDGNVLTINALKLRLKFHRSRPAEGKIKTVSVTRDAVGDYWIVMTVRKDEKAFGHKPTTGKTAGFDFGLKHFLTQDDGTRIDSPLMLLHNIDCLRKKSRRFSRKEKGSNGRKKARIALARLHRRIAAQRADFHWKLAHRLVSEYDTVCLEDLNMKAMQKLWGRKIGDLGFAEFVTKLSWLCTKYGRRLVRTDRWEPTSKTCSGCGYHMAEMPISVRTWICPECGVTHDRDINAARNILRVGTSTQGRDDVRPAQQADVDDTRIPFL